MTQYFLQNSLTSVYSLKRLLTKARRTTILLSLLFLLLNQWNFLRALPNNNRDLMKVLQNQTEEEVTLRTAKCFSDCLFYCLSYFPNFPTVKNGYNFKLKWSNTTDVLHLTTKCDWYVYYKLVRNKQLMLTAPTVHCTQPLCIAPTD